MTTFKNWISGEYNFLVLYDKHFQQISDNTVEERLWLYIHMFM